MDLGEQKTCAKEIVRSAYSILAESQREKSDIQSMFNLGTSKKSDIFNSQAIIGEISKTIKKNSPQDRSSSIVKGNKKEEEEVFLPPNQLQDQGLCQSYESMDLDKKKRSKSAPVESSSSSDDEYRKDGESSSSSSSSSSESESASGASSQDESRHPKKDNRKQETRGRSRDRSSSSSSTDEEMKKTPKKGSSKKEESEESSDDARDSKNKNRDRPKSKPEKIDLTRSPPPKGKKKKEESESSSDESSEKPQKDNGSRSKSNGQKNTGGKKEQTLKNSTGNSTDEPDKKKKARSPFTIIKTIEDISKRVGNPYYLMDELGIRDKAADEVLKKCLKIISNSRFRKDRDGYMSRWKTRIDGGRKDWFTTLDFKGDVVNDLPTKTVGNLMYDIIDKCTRSVLNGEEPDVGDKRKRIDDEKDDIRPKKKGDTPKKNPPVTRLADMSDTEKKKTVAELLGLFKIAAAHFTMIEVEPNWKKMIDEKASAPGLSDASKVELAKDISAIRIIEKDMRNMGSMFITQILLYKPTSPEWNEFSNQVSGFTMSVKSCNFSKVKTDGIECCITKKKCNKDQIFKVTIESLTDKKEILKITRFVCQKWKDILHAFYYVFLQKDIMINHGVELLNSYKGDETPALKCAFLLNNDKEVDDIFDSVRASYNRLFEEMDENQQEETLRTMTKGWF